MLEPSLVSVFYQPVRELAGRQGLQVGLVPRARRARQLDSTVKQQSWYGRLQKSGVLENRDPKKRLRKLKSRATDFGTLPCRLCNQGHSEERRARCRDLEVKRPPNKHGCRLSKSDTHVKIYRQMHTYEYCIHSFTKLHIIYRYM